MDRNDRLRAVWWILLVAALVIGLMVYRSQRDKSHIQVDPHALEVIEKAKRR